MLWWMTYGPGGPASIARVMAKAYLRIRAANPSASREQVLHDTLLIRYRPIRLPFMRVPNKADVEFMLSGAGGSLSTLTAYVWIWEQRQTMTRKAPKAIWELETDFAMDMPELYACGRRAIDQQIRKIAPEVAQGEAEGE